MTRFIKVISWRDSGNIYTQPGSVKYLNIDSIETFYQLHTSIQYNFINYYGDHDSNNLRIIDPIKIITKKGDIYYSPINLQEIIKLNIEEIDNRFDILDL